MTESVQQFLHAFDARSEAERHVAASEVLRRILASASGDDPDERLMAAAEELFLELVDGAVIPGPSERMTIRYRNQASCAS